MKLISSLGRDGVIRAGVRLRAGKSYIERVIQQLCPAMELSCDITKGQEEHSESLNPRAREFTPKRAAAVTANELIKEMSVNEESTVE